VQIDTQSRTLSQVAALPVSVGATLSLCALSALLEGFDTQSMGVAAPRVIAEFALSTQQASLIFSATPLGLFFGAAIGGRVADHFGRKRALIASLLLFGVFSLLTSMATGWGWLLTARFLTGLGLGGAMPNFISLASEATKGRHRLSVVTLIMAAMPIGGAISAVVALGAGLGWGWRSIFYIGGFVPLFLATLMMRFLQESPLVAADRRNSACVAKLSVVTALFAEDRMLTTLLLWVGFFFTQMVLLLMLNWLPQLMIGLGFSHEQASWTSVSFNLGGGLGAGFLGRLHAGARRRLWVTVTYLGMAGALLGVASIGASFPVAALACAFAGLFIIGAQLILFALAPLYYRTSIRGTGVGASVAVGRLGSVVGPLFAGLLVAYGSGSATVLLGIIPFVAIAGAASILLTLRQQSHG
jgi:MFS transporter, AAHS family, 3-hydroxyphenylpropionic acid transporter